MQLLTSLNNQFLDTTTRLQETLQDIVENVKIESNFRITHPNYKPFEFPKEELKRFQQTPQNLQDKFLHLQLRNFLYGIYYSGSLRSKLAIAEDSDTTESKPKLENNTFLGIDVEFFTQLSESNCGKGYFQPGWQVIEQEKDGSLAVQADELTLHIDRDRHLQPKDRKATIGDIVAIWTPANRLQNGFYVAIGNVGQEDRSEIVRVYFNLSPEGAIEVMRGITQQLNEIHLPFSFKVLYNPSDYGRYDSGVFYFNKSNYRFIQPLLESIYRDNQRYFSLQTPLFAKFLAPGFALAEEPDTKFASRESFGMNRCQIVANGLLQAWKNNENSPEARLYTILKHFARMGIELERSYLNANSDDIYTQLSL